MKHYIIETRITEIRPLPQGGHRKTGEERALDRIVAAPNDGHDLMHLGFAVMEHGKELAADCKERYEAHLEDMRQEEEFRKNPSGTIKRLLSPRDEQ